MLVATLCTAGAALPALLLSLQAPLLAVLVGAAAYGVVWDVTMVMWWTCLQREVPDDAISRVSSNPYTAPSRPAPKWARKRYVLPALGFAFFLGIGAGASDAQPKDDAKPTAAKAQPTATVTATMTTTAPPEPAPTVTKTVEVEVEITKTVTAQPASDNGNSDDDSNGGGNVYYENCAAARTAGAAPVHRGDPGYGSHLDRDNDGTGCDWG
ncbi:excalibur calcium-binding domain-containing protein [Streptomyces pilosus]|uniref:excalibur calcium-binding domain-containing protein n=1 Tax=Streptomyces pilosus TaxID=28893 RepID=UPI003634D3B1